jgi:hypothetical protein
MLIGKPLGKLPLGGPTRRYDNSIKNNVREMFCLDEEWMELA